MCTRLTSLYRLPGERRQFCPSMLDQEARDLEKLGVDVIQFDEPAFNVYLGETVDWGVPALEAPAAPEGLRAKLQSEIDRWKAVLKSPTN